MELHKYGASWCSPCRILANNLEKVDLGSLDTSLVEWDVDLIDRQQLVELKIRGVPTLILMDSEGGEISRKTGALTAEEIQTWLATG